MKRVFYFMMVLLLCGVLPVSAQDFVVVEVHEDLSTAVIRDRDTGEEWEVGVGDEIKGWKIWKITKLDVSIMKPGEEGGMGVSTNLRVSSELPSSSEIPVE